VIGSATAVTVTVIAAKDGGWGPDQDELALLIGAAAGAGEVVAPALTRYWSGQVGRPDAAMST